MKELLEYIVPQIVNHPDEVEIKKNEQDGIIYLTINTHPDDIGRVIGKNGKVINSLRQIARIIAIKKGVRVNIDIADSAPPQGDSEEPEESDQDEAASESMETEESSSNQEKEESIIPEEGLDLQTE